MIILAERKELLKNKTIIKSELNKIQKAFYDEDNLIEYKESNEEKLYLEAFDFLNSETINYETYHKVIGVECSDIKCFTEVLSSKLIDLFRFMNIKKLFLISHLKLDFFGNRENDFQPLINSYNLLENIVEQKTYQEAFCFDLEDLPNFIEILFWISRCDPSAPEYIFIFDESENLQMNLCISLKIKRSVSIY